MNEDDVISSAEELLRRERWPSVRVQLPGLVDSIADLCGNSYAYSLWYVLQSLPSRNDSAAQALDMSRSFAGTAAGLFRIFEAMSLDLSRDQISSMFNLIVMVENQVRGLTIEPTYLACGKRAQGKRMTWIGTWSSEGVGMLLLIR